MKKIHNHIHLKMMKDGQKILYNELNLKDKLHRRATSILLIF